MPLSLPKLLFSVISARPDTLSSGMHAPFACRVNSGARFDDAGYIAQGAKSGILIKNHLSAIMSALTQWVPRDGIMVVPVSVRLSIDETRVALRRNLSVRIL